MTENLPVRPSLGELVPVDEGDTLPPALRRRGRTTLILIGVFLLLLLLMGAVLKVDGAVIASGDITVASDIQAVSHPSGGVLAEVEVNEGEKVKAGQPLLRLDESISAPSDRFTGEGLNQLLARKARLEAERDGRGSIRFPAALLKGNDSQTASLVQRERRLFDIRRSERSGTRALLNERIGQYNQLIESYRAQIGAAQRQLELIRPELAGLRSLFERKLVTINRLNQLERQAVDLEGTIASHEASIAQTRARIAETREQMLGVDQTAKAEAGAQLADIDQQISDQQIRRASSVDALERSIVRSPVSGTIDKLPYRTVGSAVPAGDILARIVPDGESLIVEGQISPADIDQVSEGQRARITLSSLDRESTPEMAAKVTFISPERSIDERTGVSFYRVRLALLPKKSDQPLLKELKTGMPVEIFLSTGSRSILSYLFKPLFDHMDRAFR